jgi:hypothetical protein
LRRYNFKCALSLGLAIAAVWFFVIGIITAGSGRKEGAGLLGLVTMLTVPTAVVLAILGLRDLRKNSKKARGRGMALGTFWISGLMGLILVPMLISVVKNMPRNLEKVAYAKVLKFPTEQFEFHTPARPWVQVNAKNFGPAVVAAFTEPGPVTSVLMVTNLGPGAFNVEGPMVDLCKQAERRSNNPWRIVSEGTVERNGVSGWQFETLGYYQGHEVYTLTWVVTTNGFGYVLRTSSPAGIMARAKEGSDYIFSRFKPTGPNSGL